MIVTGIVVKDLRWPQCLCRSRDSAYCRTPRVMHASRTRPLFFLSQTIDGLIHSRADMRTVAGSGLCRAACEMTTLAFFEVTDGLPMTSKVTKVINTRTSVTQIISIQETNKAELAASGRRDFNQNATHALRVSRLGSVLP